MNRSDFMSAVHELADALGGRLYALVEKQSERARSAALEIAKGQLRAELESACKPTAAGPAREPGKRRRQRCSKCQSTEHNARRCDEDTAVDADTHEPLVIQPPPSPKRDRFASIEAAAATRRASQARTAAGLDGRG